MASKLKGPANPALVVPSFTARSELARYIREVFRRKGGRISSAAFLRNPEDTYLSVNSVEIDSLPDIAKHYRVDLQGGQGKVEIACHKIMKYNRAASAAGISVIRHSETRTWVFSHQGSQHPAYKHRPTHLSKSHCGVEYTIAFSDELAEKKFARRLAGHPPGKKPHIF